jgi:hypothetical protein
MPRKVSRKQKSRRPQRPERALARLEKALDAANAALVELRRAVYPEAITPTAKVAEAKQPADSRFKEDPADVNYPKIGVR